MSEQPHNEPHQNLNISDGTSLKNVQIGGIAGRDLNVSQIQGQVVNVMVYDGIYAPNGLSKYSISTVKPLSQHEYRNRLVLLDKVKNFWLKGVLENSLYNKVLIELALEERPNAVQRPVGGVEEFPEEHRQTFKESTKATNIFEQMGAGRTFLILGEPGSGKTITLLKLAQSLITRTEQNINLAIPVVFNLSSWVSKQQPIANWLVQELYNSYQISKSLGKAWVKEQQLILLLDGLDEVKVEHRDACVRALNQFVYEYGMTEIVVCSRIRDYENLYERLKLQSAICIQPLTLQQIYQYLDEGGDQLVSLKTLLQQDADLQAFAKSPLILSVMSLAYQGCSLEDLPNFSSAERRYQDLFNSYIQRMFQRRGNSHKYQKEQTKRWITWLAQRMIQESKTEFLIEQMQANWLQSRLKKIAYRFISTVIGGTFIFVVSTLVDVLFSFLLFKLFSVVPPDSFYNLSTIKSSITLIMSVMSVLLFGLFFGLGRGDIIISGTLRFSSKLTSQNLAKCLISLILILSEEPILQFLGVVGLTSGMLGIIVGLQGFQIEKTTVPNQGILKTIINTMIIGLLGALVGGLVGGLINEVIFWQSSGQLLSLTDKKHIYELIDALSMGLNLGLISGMIGGGSKAWVRHFSLRLILYYSGFIPWNYSHFLDYATERIFLQKVGGSYVFVHRMLMEHFAQIEFEQVRR